MAASGIDEAKGGIRLDGLEVDLEGREIRAAGGAAVKLTQAETRILALLIDMRGEVVTREKLMDEVAGRAWDPNDRSMDVHVSNLRKKLDACAKRATMIRTVRGAGYSLVAGD